MKRSVTWIAVVATALVLVSVSAAATYAYAGPRYWMIGEGGGSTYSASWWENFFSKERSGFDTTVTFIDNVRYGWHATVRTSASVTRTVWFASDVKKAHCLAHASHFNGGCWVHS